MKRVEKGGERKVQKVEKVEKGRATDRGEAPGAKA